MNFKKKHILIATLFLLGQNFNFSKNYPEANIEKATVIINNQGLAETPEDQTVDTEVKGASTKKLLATYFIRDVFFKSFLANYLAYYLTGKIDVNNHNKHFMIQPLGGLINESIKLMADEIAYHTNKKQHLVFNSFWNNLISANLETCGTQLGNGKGDYSREMILTSSIETLKLASEKNLLDESEKLKALANVIDCRSVSKLFAKLLLSPISKHAKKYLAKFKTPEHRKNGLLNIIKIPTTIVVTNLFKNTLGIDNHVDSTVKDLKQENEKLKIENEELRTK